MKNSNIIPVYQVTSQRETMKLLRIETIVFGTLKNDNNFCYDLTE